MTYPLNLDGSRQTLMDQARGPTSQEDVKGLVSAEDFAKFLKFTLQRQNTDYRECPNPGCGTMILGQKQAFPSNRALTLTFWPDPHIDWICNLHHISDRALLVPYMHISHVGP